MTDCVCEGSRAISRSIPPSGPDCGARVFREIQRDGGVLEKVEETN